MQLWDLDSFFAQHERKMFYVGFLKSSETWFPLCSLSDPPRTAKFDTLIVSSTYDEMDGLVKTCAESVPKVEQTLVHYLMRDEINNIMDTYGLKHVAMTNEEEGGGCGCGCGCS
jgi:hypothetical protein